MISYRWNGALSNYLTTNYGMIYVCLELTGHMVNEHCIVTAVLPNIGDHLSLVINHRMLYLRGVVLFTCLTNATHSKHRCTGIYMCWQNWNEYWFSPINIWSLCHSNVTLGSLQGLTKPERFHNYVIQTHICMWSNILIEHFAHKPCTLLTSLNKQ